MSTFFILSRGLTAKTKPIPHAGRRWLAAKALTAEERSKALAKFEGAGPFTWKEVDETIRLEYGFSVDCGLAFTHR